MRMLACSAAYTVFKMCVQTTVTPSFESIIAPVPFLRIGDQVREFRSLIGGCKFMAEEVEDTGKRKTCNGEAWERYVKQFRSNTEAAEQ